MLPSIFNDNLFDDFFNFPFYDDKAERRAEKNGKLKRSEEHTSELQSRLHLVCRLLLEKIYVN